MFIKLQTTDNVHLLISITSIDTVIYRSEDTCSLYTNKCQFTLKGSFDSIVEKFINLNIEIN